jgi:hypothetical protein
MSGVLVRDISQSRKDGTAIGGTGTPVPLYPGFSFTAESTQYIDFGNIALTTKTILVWYKPAAVNITESVYDLNGTAYMSVNSGVLSANGFIIGSTVRYVDGIVATAVTAEWHLLGITNTVGAPPNDLDIGRRNAGYANGVIGQSWAYSKVLTQTEMQNIYNVTKFRYGIAA